jgi:penicillin-binding protein 1B
VGKMLETLRPERRIFTHLVLPYRPEWRRPAFVILASIGVMFAIFAFFYIKIARKVDARLAEGAFSGTVEIFSAPRQVEGPDGKLIERPPQLITSFSGRDQKRRLVHYSDLPPNLIHAVLSAEDKHFFHHTGVDLLRIGKAAWVDFKDGRKEQGASTLTMQLARGLWLDSDKNWKRKAEELFITLHLEEKLSKEQIFQDYANLVYLGRRGPFSIRGFAEAARTYFGKDISQLSDSEAALLAGMVQRPSYYNPFHDSDRARERRDIVLGRMRDNGYLTDAAYERALATPLEVTHTPLDNLQEQYFVDFMNHELETRLEDRGNQARAVYTTLDPDLQKAADEAVRIGMQQVDAIVRKRRGPPIPSGEPQVALIALDPHSGEIKALVGGRNYAQSQLNRTLALRQPGSVFKPIVYTAALESAIRGGEQIFTPATMLDDSPTTFAFNGRMYQPSNFKGEFMGDVTLRTALMHSLNVATVSLAEQVGYGNVVDMAHRLGLNENIQPTPAVALGAYVTTPVGIAQAYTALANSGKRVTPSSVEMVRGPDGSIIYQHMPDPRRAIDRRIAYLMVNMMQDVLRSGTGAGVRARGFTLPAAGKTGTSRDGWFAGFTSKLECIVWVGFDDNRDLDIEGAHSALPIWTEFMKRAAKLPEYRDPAAFTMPSGIVSEKICSESGRQATDYCPEVRQEVFIGGTEPTMRCQLHSARSVDTEADRAVTDNLQPAADAEQTTPRLKPTTPPPAVPDRSGNRPERNDNH